MLLLLQLEKYSGALEWEFNEGRVVLREPQEKKKSGLVRKASMARTQPRPSSSLESSESKETQGYYFTSLDCGLQVTHKAKRIEGNAQRCNRGRDKSGNAHARKLDAPRP
jgi:hypothetical protein